MVRAYLLCRIKAPAIDSRYIKSRGNLMIYWSNCKDFSHRINLVSDFSSSIGAAGEWVTTTDSFILVIKALCTLRTSNNGLKINQTGNCPLMIICHNALTLHFYFFYCF